MALDVAYLAFGTARTIVMLVAVPTQPAIANEDLRHRRRPRAEPGRRSRGAASRSLLPDWMTRGHKPV